ncbi:MAG: molybdenum cofactor guanylyltransferase [Syntrophomonadaceae bacterium]|nr:molybdenum cofactor guanylyltransferase [Syntrophomonadaceae bacterium]
MEASGVILAGGKSSRMKSNKAFAKIVGKPSIEIIIDRFTSFFAETMIISNEVEVYQGCGIKIYPDVYPGLGPISGIHSGLYHSNTDGIFVIGCDMPFVNMELVQLMLEKLEGYDAVVPEIDSFLQPISAVYRKTCLPVFTECLENKRLKLTMVFNELNTLILDEKDIKQFGDAKEIFFNINDLEDLKLAQQMAGRLL